MNKSTKRVDYSTKESKDVKNWQYELSYSQIAQLKDFPQLLLRAFKTGVCVGCGSLDRLDDNSGGLCYECIHNLSEEGLDTYCYVIGRFQLKRSVELRDVRDNRFIELEDRTGRVL